MKKIFLLILAFHFINLPAKAQENKFESGYANLVVTYSSSPNTNRLTTVNYASTFENDRPSKLIDIDDTTQLLSIYTLGPVKIYFHYGNKMHYSVIYPNSTDSVKVYLNNDKELLNIEYFGKSKSLFENSDVFFALGAKAFDNSYPSLPNKSEIEQTYSNINNYKNHLLDSINSYFALLSSSTNIPLVRSLLDDMKDYTKYNKLLNEKTSKEIDSLQKNSLYFNKSDDFYNNIINSSSEELLFVGYNYLFLKSLNSNLSGDSTFFSPWVYSQDIYKKLGLKAKDNSISEALITLRYLNQIFDGSSLDSKQKKDILLFFNNRHVINYIFYHNDKLSLVNQPHKNGYLPFKSDNENILKNIINRFPNKVLVIDFWATWCGPCRAAFDEIHPLKLQYKDNPNIEFVYITDESSDNTEWNNFVDILGGQHYYLYRNQFDSLNKQFDITSLPSYLIFDKSGKLVYKSLGHYMGNEKLTKIIESNL